MSSRNTNSNRSNRSTNSTNRKSTGRDPKRVVFDPSTYENRVYRKERKLDTIGVGIRRGDTRHGDYSQVVVWRWSTKTSPSQRFTMSLSEARSLKAFLDRELEVRAR